MSATTQPFRLRPGTWADIPRAASLYTLAFRHDTLMDFLFPDRATHPDEWHAAVVRIFQTRYWSLGWRFTVLVDENDVPQAFTWWNRGKAYESLWRRWLSPTSWFAPLVRGILKIRNLLFPFRARNDSAAFGRIIFDEMENNFLTTPRLRAAHYLSILIVNPALQGKGLGALLVRDGLRDVDACGAASYLCRVAGLREFYEKFGFKEVGSVAVRELAKWDGGQIMVRQ